MSTPEVYDVYAIRYGHREDRKRFESYIMSPFSEDPHDAPMPISYFVWAIVNERRTIVVDTGFDRAEMKRRHDASGGKWVIDYACEPAEGLEMIGVDASKVEDVVITHLHYDHAGTIDRFPKARFHLQEREMQFATGPHMAHSFFRGAYTVDHVTAMVNEVYRGRVAYHDGDAEIAPGITLHHVGGHTAGMQSVCVNTRRGRVVLASDASHFYGNLEDDSPFPVVHSVGDMLRGFARLRALADSERHVVPGHDPLVLERYPAPRDDLAGKVVRLDVEPKA